MPVTLDVATRGVARRDYSTATEKFVEPVISSWQSVYLYQANVVVPPEGSLTTDVAVELGQVVLVYDFFASIPSNRLIRLEVFTIDSLGVAFRAVNKYGFQTVVSHITKGIPFLATIRFVTYNYSSIAENYMRIGCSGIYTSEEEYYLRLAPETPP